MDLKLLGWVLLTKNILWCLLTRLTYPNCFSLGICIIKFKAGSFNKFQTCNNGAHHFVRFCKSSDKIFLWHTPFFVLVVKFTKPSQVSGSFSVQTQTLSHGMLCEPKFWFIVAAVTIPPLPPPPILVWSPTRHQLLNKLTNKLQQRPRHTCSLV